MIDVQRRDDVAVIELRHGRVNALDLELVGALAATVRELAEAPIVLTGRGGVFSAGVDLRRLVDGGADYVARFLPALDEALLAVFEAPGPVVAAVNGHAIAGGCILAAACDVRLMSGGRIGVPELLVGLPFPVAALEILRHAAGSRVDELALTGRTVDTSAAVALGLVHEIVPPESLLEEAVRRAGALAQIPQLTYRLTKEQLRGGARQRIEAARRAHHEGILAAWQREDARAAVAAYVDRLAQRDRARP
jgi:enoyl-CoA hydratase